LDLRAGWKFFGLNGIVFNKTLYRGKNKTKTKQSYLQNPTCKIRKQNEAAIVTGAWGLVVCASVVLLRGD